MTSMFENDPFGPVKSDQQNATSPPARAVNAFHRKADTDSSPLSLHHTLGSQRNQAAPGSHGHEGTDSRKLGYNQSLSIIGAKGTPASEDSIVLLLSRFIEFTDGRT